MHDNHSKHFPMKYRNSDDRSLWREPELEPMDVARRLDLARATTPAEGSGERGSILLVEDDEDLAAVLSTLLEARGYSVCVAHRGVHGIWDVLSKDFDVIICDMVMPTMPGDMFYLAVKKVKPYLSRRFIFITGHSQDSRVSSFLATVETTILIKPLVTQELFTHIDAVISDTARRRALAVEPEQFEWFPGKVT